MTQEEFIKTVVLIAQKIWARSNRCEEVDLDDVQHFIDFCAKGPAQDERVFEFLQEMEEEDFDQFLDGGVPL